MACDADLQRKDVTHQDTVINHRMSKRCAPDSFRTHVQEFSHKLRKTEAKSTTAINDGKHLQSYLGAEEGKVSDPHMQNRQRRIKQNAIIVKHSNIKQTVAGNQDSQVLLPLKVKYESSFRRFTIPGSLSFRDLKLSLAKKLLEDKVMSVQYIDDHGDRVVLSSDKDMAEFFRLAVAGGTNPIQLRVNLWPR